MKRHLCSGILLVLLGAVGCGAAFAADMPDTSKMNVLFINIEDCAANVWGCYGNTICKTPNIDRFASTAVRFDRAYCQAICCNPSRTSFLTGLRPLSTHVLSNGHVMDEHLPAGTPTLPEMLADQGVYTAVIGKLFHRVDYADEQLATFDRIEHYDQPAGWEGPGPILDFPPVRQVGPPDPAPKDRNSAAYREWRTRHSDRYGDSGLEREEEKDYRMAKTAVALLKEFSGTGQQFFLALSQSRPHTPLIAPKKYVDMYDPAQIPDPPAPVDSLVGFPYMSRATGGNPDIFMQRQPTPEQVKGAIAAYYACGSFVDDNIGMVLDALEEYGLDMNTIVVFLGDHGFHLGDHGCWSKYSMLEATRRVTLIVRVPGAPENGKACGEFVEFVDLVPTLGELLGMRIPGNLEGTSFVPLLADADRPWKSAVFMVDSDGGQMVRTHDYSLLQLKPGKGEGPTAALYDLRKDPWETVNLIDSTEAEDVAARERLAGMIEAGWKSALPGKAE